VLAGSREQVLSATDLVEVMRGERRPDAQATQIKVTAQTILEK
jgi:hypothetical protein